MALGGFGKPSEKGICVPLVNFVRSTRFIVHDSLGSRIRCAEFPYPAGK
jgi:hypothetical protein